MALVFRDRVLETTTTVGTGTLTLAGAVSGFQAFSAIGNGNTAYYSAWEVDANGNPNGAWEVGLGTYTLSGTTLARTSVIASSNSNNAVNFAAGTKRVACVMPASGTVVVRQPGGTPGTDEVQISHDGTKAVIESKDGPFNFLTPDSTITDFICAGLGGRWRFGTSGIAKIDIRSSGGFKLASDTAIEWHSGTSISGSPDTNLKRAGPKVVGIGDGSSGAGTLSSPNVSPSQITSNQDDYNPGVARNYRLSSDASRNITGLAISQVDGQECFFRNVGAQNIVLKHDVTSTAANRFYCAGSADITLAPNDIAILCYDSTDQRWRVGKL